MPLSWNEIRHNSIRFARDWAGARSESAEKQTFWNEFFETFGLKRRRWPLFEEPVKNIRGQYGFIDLFWPGMVLVEHKSFGKDLGKAESQAFRYIQDLAREGRAKEIPRYIIISDFARIALHDLEPEEQRGLPLFEGRRVATVEFPLAGLHRHIHDFAFIPGYKQHKFAEQDPINFEAVEILGRLHDTLEAGGYASHELERFLVRILFCLFAEDTGLFERDAFRLYLENRTAGDGSDLGLHLARLFEVLDTPTEKRQKNLDETLAAFPYVNGALFAERLGFADFNRDMRNALLACTRFDWSRISPAIFGSLFQAVMQPKERRQIGGHYTSERDILKVARSLFLDDLSAEFAARKNDRSTGRRARLEEFHDKLCKLHFLDPACGCGNFLVITYRELRQLELETLKELFGKQTEMTLAEINRLSQVDVDQFYGIEISEWPARIAEVALWLMDHQMNLKVSEAFGQLYQRLPLKKSPHIHCANALRTDWKQILPPAQCSYVLGNPPFVGKTYMTNEQRADMESVASYLSASGLLDYVTAWYFKAGEYIQGTKIVVGFVSTNSITQGEQVGLIWNDLFQRLHLKIHFAHRTFAWMSEARGKAHAHVVIIGFSAFDIPNKLIFDYEVNPDNPTKSLANNISPYLVEGSDTAVQSRTTPICDAPPIVNGSKQVDGGFLILTDSERAELLNKCPAALPFVRTFLGSAEFINGTTRWCLWLVDAPPSLVRNCEEIRRRIDGVREFRLASKKEKTRESAATPSLFGEIRPIKTNFLAIPEVSSERRFYIPIGFLPPTVIPSNKIQVVPNATTFHFGILSSAMHMAWMRQVTGRMKSDYSYSTKIVYNNFPWPENPNEKQRAAVEETAQAVLDTRLQFPDATLADLYDPLAMPPALVKAHAELDRAVDLCYRREPFETERQRVEYLFSLYEKLTAPLLPVTPKTKSRRSKTAATSNRLFGGGGGVAFPALFAANIPSEPPAPATAAPISSEPVRPAPALPMLPAASVRIDMDDGPPSGLVTAAAPVSAPDRQLQDPPSPSLKKPIYRVWYGTNRKPLDSADHSKGYSEKRDELIHYGACDVLVPKSHKFGQIRPGMIQRLRELLKGENSALQLEAVVPFEKLAFWQSIKQILQQKVTDDRHVLVYLHGYRVSFEEAALRAAQIGADLKIPGLMSFYSWPSKGTLEGYAADEATIEASESFITDFLIKIAIESNATKVHILAHSMGNRGLLRAWQRILEKAQSQAGIKFGQIILAAPDVDADIFKTLAAAYTKISDRTTLYVSAKDKAVGLSKFLHEYPRAGYTPPITIVSSLDTVEVSNIDVTILGHSYFAEAAAVLYDISELLLTNRPPVKRLRLSPMKTAAGEDYWQIVS